MNDEDILRGVAARASEQEQDAELERLERLARGEPVAESELAGIDPDIVAMFRPIGPAAEQRIADRIVETRPLAEVRSLRPGWVKWTPVLAAAAALIAFFSWPRSHEALPVYAFELSGNVAELRADGPQVAYAKARLHKEATLEIVLRPADKVSEKLAVRAALVRGDKALPWSPPITISDEGAVRIVGPVKSLFPDLAAPWDIVVAIGPESALPSTAEALLAATTKGASGCRLVRGTVEFVP